MSLKYPIFYRQEGLAYEVMQWYICRMEAWFAADADMISLKFWDQASISYLTETMPLLICCSWCGT